MAPRAATTQLRLEWRPFAFPLPRPLRTAAGSLAEKKGWLLRLECPGGPVGWGEAAPLDGDLAPLARAIAALGVEQARMDLERALPALPSALAFALAAALAETDGLVGPAAGGWQPAPAGAWLLPAGVEALQELERLRSQLGSSPSLKWKVAATDDRSECDLLERLLERLPGGARLRLDANGGWDRATARAWAERLVPEVRLEWLEQPLAPHDGEGLDALHRLLPVALDESLTRFPALRRQWPGWQVRRPSQDGDPRPLLAALQAGRPLRMVSTAFETGIGRRWLDHLAALQAAGPTPVAPGLAPGWLPQGPLFASDPEQVWEAAA
ncbi:o-succinylbenzoate synthase [Cyanobium sp. FGCU-6]|jgi:O-succinylbenzoate synthase|nr:o-succinylbenzoate synthase [Cyanobium sp. FGCU6]